jgi:uracil-DNA glycosylase family 4
VETLTDILVASDLPGDCRVAFSAAVKCPSVRESDMKTADTHACRQHLWATIDQVKPKLVFACGNLAFKMVTKKSGITTKRGNAFDIDTGNHQFVCVPIFHPYAVHTEPKNRYIFEQDIKNALAKVITGIKAEKIPVDLIMSDDDLDKILWLADTDEDIAVDTETTGLNFLTDKLNTIAISAKDKNYAIPLLHKDTPWEDTDYILNVVKKILENPNNRKVFHNAKFDLKFLHNVGIYPTNVYDTKLMAHLWNEDVPKSLKELVKLFFPEGIDQL